MSANLIVWRRRSPKEPTFLQYSEVALCARSNRFHSCNGIKPINSGEFLRLCGEFLRQIAGFLRHCGEFLRRNGEFLRRFLCKGMFSNSYSAPESRGIMNLLERGGKIKFHSPFCHFGKGLHIPSVFSRCIRQAGLWVEALRRAAV